MTNTTQQLSLLNLGRPAQFDWDRHYREAERRVQPVDPSEHIDLSNANQSSSAMTLENTLILMACSATKRPLPEGQCSMPLMEMYDGPMWQTLRTRLGERHARVVVLSGKFGIIGASAHWAPYEARISPQKADHLIRRGLLERQDWFGELPELTTSPLSDLKCPTTRINSPEPFRPLPWQGVIVAAGGEYRRVFMALLRQLQQWGDLAPDAAILATRGGIGEQRSQLGAWVSQIAGDELKEAQAA
jgi:hypothetical protein